MGRTFLGTEAHLGGSRRVFEIEDGLEVDENNFTQIERTRVYFDDVLGVTYHREFGWAYLIAVGSASVLLFFGIVLPVVNQSLLAGGVAMIIIGAPFLVAFILRLILKVDVISVYGRRTKARIKFSFRKARARQIYNDLTAKIRARQAKALAEQPPAPPPAAPEIPLPPPPSPPA